MGENIISTRVATRFSRLLSVGASDLPLRGYSPIPLVKSLFRPLLRLQWKLTFSYTWITVMTLVILALAGVIAGSEAVAANFSQLVIGDLKAHAPELVPYVSATPPTERGLSNGSNNQRTLLHK